MIKASIKGVDLELNSHEQLFSPRSIDKGTLAMLSVIDFDPEDKVLDLGCGYGVVGILAARLIGEEKVTMLDNDPVAIEVTKENALLNKVPGVEVLLSDGYLALDDTGFTKIICHPPYHVDFAVPKLFIEKGFNRLGLGGQLFMVTRRKEWYKNKLTAIFGGVRVWEIDDYFVFMSSKRDAAYAGRKIKTPAKKRR